MPSSFSKADSGESAEGPKAGPEVKVGWMAGRWYRWNLPDGKAKFELVKFDTRNVPFVEAKGAGAPKYVGPKAEELDARFGS